MNINFSGDRKCLPQQIGPPIVEMERTEGKDISMKRVYTLPKITIPSQLNLGQLIYWRNPFSTTGILSNIGWQSPFGRSRDGGFGIYEY